MITIEQTITAIRKLEKMHNDTRARSRQMYLDISKMFSSFDEKFIYDTYTRAGKWNKEYRELDIIWDFGSHIYFNLRSPNWMKPCDNYPYGSVEFCYNSCYFVHAWRYRECNSNQFISCMSSINESTVQTVEDYLSYVQKKMPDWENFIYTKAIEFAKHLKAINDAIDLFYAEYLPIIAKFLVDKYNYAVELDNENDSEFESLFGGSNSRKRIKVAINISEE